MQIEGRRRMRRAQLLPHIKQIAQKGNGAAIRSGVWSRISAMLPAPLPAPLAS
ncbi:hypothetical protein [Bosea sp. LjRoot237]|uniref:hypothetical protein n=1 Tax=Bosea sp. LjRoot237 TaxID=3342292 RepID=UPI003ECC5828